MCARHDVVAPAPTDTHQRARQMLTLQGLSQNADHLAHNSPFLACFAEWSAIWAHHPSLSITTPGKWRHENTDMPKERSSCCKTPALLMRERSEHHNENSTFSQHVLSVLVVGYPPSTPTSRINKPKVTIQPPRYVLSPKRPITRRRLVTTKRERGPLPGLLTVDYFTTSPGGILAPHTKVSKFRARRERATWRHNSTPASVNAWTMTR